MEPTSRERTARRTWTLKRTVHDTAKPRSGEPYDYSYKLPRTVAIPGWFRAHGFLVLDTGHLVIGLNIWLADEDGGMAGWRLGLGPFHWEVLCGRLYSKRALARLRARRLVTEAEEHLKWEAERA